MDDLDDSGSIQAWRFVGQSGVLESALMIAPGHLLSNYTYQFKVELINRNNQTLRANGFVLVQVESAGVPMILQG